MPKRKLNSDEIKLCERNLKILREEYEMLVMQEKVCSAHLDFILEANYKRMRRDYKKKLEEAKNGINQITKTISTLKDQMQNGVEKKEDDKNGNQNS